MATRKTTFAASANLTVTLASLGADAGRESTAIDNGTNLYLDAQVGGKITTGTTPTVDTAIIIYAYGSADDGTTYSGNATGTDAAYAPTNTQQRFQLRQLGTIQVSATSDVTYEFGPFSVALAFGGYLPEDWGIVVWNQTDAALNATPGNHEIHYQGITEDIA